MAMKPGAKRKYLHDLVASKNQWMRPLTAGERALGFLGWHERGYLPHCDFPNLVQFVTFRLEDSMPVNRRSEWEHLLKIEDVREKRTKLEEYLDRGMGKCWLRDSRVAKIAEEALLHFHDDRYELLAWCIMPNHVHVLVDVRMTPLWKMVRSWKQFIQKEANRILAERRPPARLDESGNCNTPCRRPALRSFWQREYWDTFMRDAEQKRKAIHYIENNPVKAKLFRRAEESPCSSARFRDEYRRLVVQSEMK